tara:strand:- start:32 stop:445 length:414 start_codon:yes stop_codon:yes gene_type:complete
MSTLVIDTIQGKTTAGSVNVRGEGSNNTNLQQGLAKCFSSLAHEGGTPTAKDTFNVASYTDSNTGAVVVSYTNNMSVAIHCVTALANYRSGSAQFKHISYNNNTAFTTASHELISGEGSWSKQDAENMSSIASGDLA